MPVSLVPQLGLLDGAETAVMQTFSDEVAAATTAGGRNDDNPGVQHPTYDGVRCGETAE
jgi:hypothetical protein